MDATNIILQLLNIVVAGTAAIAQLDALRAQVQAMTTEGREPTEAEWAALQAMVDGLGVRLDAADQRLSPPSSHP